jgi:hypothetical protein
VEGPEKAPAGIAVRTGDDALRELETPDRSLELMATEPVLDARIGESTREEIV